MVRRKSGSDQSAWSERARHTRSAYSSLGRDFDEASSIFVLPLELPPAVVVGGGCLGGLCATGPIVEELLLSDAKVGAALLTKVCVLAVLATLRGTKAKGEAIVASVCL